MMFCSSLYSVLGLQLVTSTVWTKSLLSTCHLQQYKYCVCMKLYLNPNCMCKGYSKLCCPKPCKTLREQCPATEGNATSARQQAANDAVLDVRLIVVMD